MSLIKKASHSARYIRDEFVIMEEINKQRTEMNEMAGVWRECLRRYREISDDFTKLKQQLGPGGSVARAPQGEGAASYHLPQHYVHPMAAEFGMRAQASAPPAPPAWWGPPRSPRASPRRRPTPRDSSPQRRRHKDREDVREKSRAPKTSTAHSEHRHRRR